MTEEQRRIHDNPLWWENQEKCARSIERWQKSPGSLEEALEQSRRLEGAFRDSPKTSSRLS